MKTVMKKMFCLLLVAVMLVGVMPFAAFADGEVKCTKDGCPEYDKPATRQPDYDVAPTCTEAGKIGYYCQGGHKIFTPGEAALEHAWGQPYLSVEPTCTATGVQVKKCERCGETVTTNSSVPTLPHDFSEATCTAPKTCSVCGATEGATLSHTWDDATCTAPKTCSVCGTTEGAANDHSYGSDNVCDVCNYCNNCGETITDGDAKKHKTTCKFHPDFNKECTKCGTEYTALETHPTCDHCNNVYASSSNPCHATANCPYCLVCLEKEDYVKAHKTADHCDQCGNTDGTHKVTCSKAPNTGNALVRVHVRLHNGTTLVDTVELLTYRDDKGTQIGDSVSAHKSLIVAELAEEYPEYSWSGNLYDDPGDSQDYNEKIGTGTTVYINAYAGQDMVLVYVHNSRSFNNLRIIQLEGKRRGDTVTKKEVTSAVSKYYNVSSLSMYSEDAWEDYVAGENVESVSSLKIPSDDAYYVIDVKISGTAKSGSGSGYTADSSNPKTGDSIFAPVAVMGLSVSALAVLLYLNKKRAF